MQKTKLLSSILYYIGRLYEDLHVKSRIMADCKYVAYQYVPLSSFCI